MKKHFFCTALCLALLLTVQVFASETDHPFPSDNPLRAGGSAASVRDEVDPWTEEEGGIAPDAADDAEKETAGDVENAPTDAEKEAAGDAEKEAAGDAENAPAGETPEEVPAPENRILEPGTAYLVVNGAVLPEHVATFSDDYTTTYASVGDVTRALRPDAAITWEDGQIVCRGTDFTLTARLDDRYLVVNDRCLYIPGGVRMDEVGNTLVPTRVLAAALGANVAWNDETDAVEFTSAGAPLISGRQYYDPEVLDLLARVITHESGNQPLDGKIAVGNVVLNRVAHPSYPNTVAEVLAQPYQFPNATSREPNAESILAAKLCLDGAVTVPGAYWFNGVGKPCWASRNKTLLTTIGGHAFYG